MADILIIGGGSIGKRHLRNILALGGHNPSLVEVNSERAAVLQKEFVVQVYESLDTALSSKTWPIIFICSPSVYHLDNALASARHGADIFIEKPVSHNLDGVEKLAVAVSEKKIITMVGSNWKFYPLFQKMKELIDGGAIGRILSARCQFGQYLPDWHPWEDYRNGYSANSKLGGGALLDSHEFDYLSWFLGPVKKLACIADHVSNLEIDVEDVAEVAMKFESGTIGEIHLDYLQRFYQRSYEFYGETGTMLWDVNAKKVIVKNKERGAEEYPIDEDYDLNTMYVEEIKHFLECVEQRKPTITPLEHGIDVLRLIMAAKESASSDKVITI